MRDVTANAEPAELSRTEISARLADAAAAQRFTNRRRRFEAGFSERRRQRTERFFSVASFIVLVAAPMAASTLFFGWMASDRYVAEAHFLLRPNKAQLATAPGEVESVAAQIGRDTQVVADYLIGPAAFLALDEELDLRARLTTPPPQLADLLDPPTPDALTGLAADATYEDAVAYWKSMVATDIDPSSGVVTLRVVAFSEDDALLIADRALVRADALVNAMNARIWDDALAQAQAAVEAAAARLTSAEAGMAQLRNEEGLVSADAAATAATGMTVAARGAVAELERQRAALSAYLRPEAPAVRLLDERIAAGRAQIAELDAQMTGSSESGASGQSSLSRSLERFGAPEMEREVARRSFLTAASQLERARQARDARSLYLEVFAPPQRPDEAVLPHRALWVGVTLACALALWAMARGLFGLVRNHMA